MSEKLSKNLGKIRELLKNFQEICRVCEEKSSDMLHINNQNIKHMLKVCTSVTVSQTCELCKIYGATNIPTSCIFEFRPRSLD